MSQVRQRLHKAIEQQQAMPKRPRPPADIGEKAMFRPVHEAAKELSDELAKVPGLGIEIEPTSVWIGFYDKHFWLGYDAEEHAFVGSETDTLWMEGGIREHSFRWNSADECTEAMIQACARYVSLAEAMRNLLTKR